MNIDECVSMWEPFAKWHNSEINGVSASKRTNDLIRYFIWILDKNALSVWWLWILYELDEFLCIHHPSISISVVSECSVCSHSLCVCAYGYSALCISIDSAWHRRKKSRPFPVIERKSYEQLTNNTHTQANIYTWT